MTNAGNMLMLSSGKKGWTNPYITDGLVAMYDGEWNLAGGKHTDEKVCKNIVADKWHGQVGSGVTIGNNYFGFPGTSGANYAINLGNEYFGKLPNMTFEVCFVSEGTGAHGSQSPFGGIAAYNYSGITFFNNTINCWTSLATSSSASRNWYIANWLADQKRHSISFIVGVDSSFVAYDNVKKAERQGCTIDWTKTVGVLYIGAKNGNPTEYPLNGKVFSVRVYGRALTENEIAANNAVDKIRFNLP